MIMSIIAHHCAENFDARLAGIFIWTDCPLLEKNVQGDLKSMKIDKKQKMHAQKIQDVFFLRVPNRRRQLPPVAQLGGHCNRVKGRFRVNNRQENSEKGRFQIFQKCQHFNMSKLKSCNVSGNSFRISKNPDMGEIQKSKNISFFLVGVTLG